MGAKRFWNKRNTISIFIVLIMVSSGIGMMWGRDSDPSTKYKGHTIIARDNLWWIKQGKNEIAFNFHPLDVENITMDPQIKEKLLNTLMFYITFNPEQPPEYMDTVRFSFLSALQIKDIYVESSIIQESSDFALPIIDCSNATQFVPVLKFELSETNETNIILEDNCIIAQAKDDVDIVRLKDRIIYSLFDII